MVYAQISGNIIRNTIVVAEYESNLDLFLEGFDHLIRIDNLSPTPGIGWSYQDENFNPPPPEPAPPVEE